jgi:hypothetical protein
MVGVIYGMIRSSNPVDAAMAITTGIVKYEELI